MNALTPSEIVAEVSRHKGGYSMAAFYRHKLELKLAPVGSRQRPQLYPGETATKILAHLGLAGAPGPATASPLPAKVRRSRSLLSVPELKATRPVPATALRKPALAPRGKVSR